MGARKLVDKVLKAGRWPPPDDVAAVEAAGAAALEPLRDVVRSDLRRRPEQITLWVIIGLLGELGAGGDAVAETVEALAGLYRRYDDDTLESVNEAVVKLGPAALPALAEVVQDRSVRWYGRAMAAAASVRLSRGDEEAVAGVARLLRAVLDERPRSGEFSDNDRALAASVAWGLAVLPDPSARGAIESAFKRGAITEPTVSRDAIAEAYARKSVRPRPAPEPFLAGYRRRWELQRMDAEWLEKGRKK